MEESASFLEKRSKKFLFTVGVGDGGAKCFSESKFFCFFLFTQRRLALLLQFQRCWRHTASVEAETRRSILHFASYIAASAWLMRLAGS
jgi:hypothetical protein